MSKCSGLKQEMPHASGEDSVRINSCGGDLAPTIRNGEDWLMSTTWDMQLHCSGEQGCRLEPVEKTVVRFTRHQN